MPCGYLKKFGGPGKGRKKKLKTRTRFYATGLFGETAGTISWESGHHRRNTVATNYFRHGPSVKRVKHERKIRRQRVKKLTAVLKNEDKVEKEEKEEGIKKMKVRHEKKLRQLRQRFFRDINALWQEQADEMSALM
jgi:hypothetical protein